MKPGRLDVVSKRILTHLAQDATMELEEVAQHAGCTVEVARERIAAMKRSGVLRGVHVRLDAVRLGRPHEILVTGSPSSRTDREALRRLCDAPGVTRVFTLASRNSVAFTLCGRDMAEVEATAGRLAEEAGLEDPRFTLIVNTLMDDQVHGISDMLPARA